MFDQNMRNIGVYVLLVDKELASLLDNENYSMDISGKALS